MADPARPIRVQGAPAGMRALRHCRHLQVAGEDLGYPGAARRIAAAGNCRRRLIEPEEGERATGFPIPLGAIVVTG
ncbi:hypothetical protein EMEDMD4_440073 [Sinorhizobium medicae]|uniref:Uncharacterized protein n=1 Tax=Sinorhizobium medicae TaxID=110321 RepID=A0A508WZ47_9HYPH|nr:hypothetical protein EMEDMD4_440073 [Sinorhizobium medicae]